jgi:hypothetical protein
MKLTTIVLENVLPSKSHQIGRLADGINLISGERGAGKTALRQFVRDILLGNARHLEGVAPNHPSDFALPRGELSIGNGREDCRIRRNGQTGELQTLTPAGLPISNPHSLSLITDRLHEDLYDTVFNFSLSQSRESLSRLARVLHRQFNVPRGKEAANGESQFLASTRQKSQRREQLVALQQRIDTLKAQRQETVAGCEQNDSVRQVRISELERELTALHHQINEINLATARGQISKLEREIEELRLWIEETSRRENHQVRSSNRSELPDSYQLLYVRFDELESQIRRWQRIQAEVQAQRVRLKDEMVVWGEMTLESQEHPYHNALKLLNSLDQRINQTDVEARQWEQAPAHQTDPSHSVRAIQSLCHEMHQDLQLLSQELGHQYKTIRHRAAAAELKQLRHCYHIITENVDRLLRHREQILHEIRYLDPPGLEAITRGEAAFLQCALHEGYAEARRRFVGPFPAMLESLSLSPSNELTEARNRLHFLQSEVHRAQRSMVDGEATLFGLNSRRAQLQTERASLAAIGTRFVSSELAAIELDLNRLSNEQANLLKLVDAETSCVQPLAHPLLTQAASYLQQLTGGECQAAWLSDSTEDAIEVSDAAGNARPALSLSNANLNFLYLALALAAMRALTTQGLEIPTIIDDVFIDFSPAQANSVMRLLSAVAKEGHQLILLTQNPHLEVDWTGITRFVLPSHDQWARRSLFSGAPIISGATATTPSSSRQAKANPMTADALTRWIDAGDIDPSSKSQVDLPGWASPQPAYPLSKDYPFSKYALPSESAHKVASEEAIDRYPSLLVSDRLTSLPPLNRLPSRATPVGVDSVGDPLSFAPAVDELTELDRINLLDLNRLRALSEVGIDTVGELLEVPPECLPLGLREHGITSEQINRWQAVVWLLCNVPVLRVADARILVACGVTEPEHLASSHPQQLLERVQRFVSSAEGQRFTNLPADLDLTRVHGWLRSLQAFRSKWQMPNRLSRLTKRRERELMANEVPPTLSFQSRNEPMPFSKTVGSGAGQGRGLEVVGHSQDLNPIAKNRSARADLLPHREFREPFIARPPRMRTPEPVLRASAETISQRMRPIARDQIALNQQDKLSGDNRQNSEAKSVTPTPTGNPKLRSRRERPENPALGDSKLRFFLDLKDHVEAAPSIGPKTAERFQRIGIHTVDDFLAQTAESMATKLKYRRITADLIRSWQHQTRLVCRIPNLRGHDAQLLVACDLVEPEKIAGMQPQRLLDIILPFARSKEGMKIVRTGKEPDLQEVCDWIKWASMTRSLHAA